MTSSFTDGSALDAKSALLSASDLEHLRSAIALADEGRRRGRHPFGALVVGDDGEVLAQAWNNSMPPEGDPTQHAELTAVATAAREGGLDALSTATLYTSAEPCAMCTGAVYWCGVGRIVYALSETRLLDLTGDNPENPTLALPCRAVLQCGQRPVQVVGPALEDEAASSHLGFWR